MMERNEMIKRCLEANIPVMMVGSELEELKPFAIGNTAILRKKEGYSFEDGKMYIAELKVADEVRLLNKYDLPRVFENLEGVETLMIENLEDFMKYTGFSSTLAGNLDYKESKERHYLFTTENEYLINRAVSNRIRTFRKETIQENEDLKLAE